MIRRPPRSTRTAHSFPTRRSSDLRSSPAPTKASMRVPKRLYAGRRTRPFASAIRVPAARSEEHTSELQSLMRISYAVFCLKKKNNKQRFKNNQLNVNTQVIDYSHSRNKTTQLHYLSTLLHN